MDGNDIGNKKIRMYGGIKNRSRLKLFISNTRIWQDNIIYGRIIHDKYVIILDPCLPSYTYHQTDIIFN